jgi:high-affinity iron transporter
MLETFVIVLREGIEAALVVAILVASLRKAGREDLYSRVTQGLAAAALASIAGAVLLRALSVNEEIFEGGVMLVAAAFVATMMWWMHRVSQRLKTKLDARVAAVGASGGGWSMFWLTFVLVGREGIEAVLFLTAASLDSQTLSSVVGGLAGLALAVGFGVAFARGSVRVNLRRFFSVTNFVLGILLVQLFVGGLHELGEGGVLPVGPREMAVIGPIVKNNVLFVLAVLLVPLFILVTAPAARRIEGDGPEARLARARERRERRGLGAAAALSVTILAVLSVDFARAQASQRLTPAEPVAAEGGTIRIPLSHLSDGHLHRYVATVSGNAVRFLLLESGGRVHSAFDACQICGADGYNERGGQVICLHCDATINKATIGRGGGCNPLPLPSTVERGQVLVRESDLAREATQFPAAR